MPPVQAREAGQWAIGTALGLYFTAPVLAVLARYAPWIALAVLLALGLGMVGSWLLQRVSGADRATAFFAMAVGGAVEMAVQGERHGALFERVAAAHSLRILLVVATIPLTVRWWSGRVTGCTLAAMLLAGGFALAQAYLAGILPGTALLATSPGGIAEMSLTARVLHLGVPIVSAFHVARMVTVVLVAGPLYRLSLRTG